MTYAVGPQDQPAAFATGIVKRFGPRAVLSEVNITVGKSQVHALIGANGSGKSTLSKIIAGYYRRDEGQVFIGGVEVPSNAGVAGTESLGVRVVHQDLGLIDGVSVLENIAVGSGYSKTPFGLIDWDATARRAKAALARVGLEDLDPAVRVDLLPTWQRVAVACARALFDGLECVRLLILDEITAALPPGEVRLVLDLVRRLKALGAGILYVTHRFEEVMDVTDQITVLRDGKLLVSTPTAQTSVRQLVEWVSGDKASESRGVLRPNVGKPVLEINGLTTARLKNITLSISQGEICGVIGRAGCGRSALGRTVFGQERIVGGSLVLAGERFQPRHPRDAISRGVAYVPQDRQRAGILPGATVRENFTISNLRKVTRRGQLSARVERGLVARLIQHHNVVPADGEASIHNLSGGNQQKIVVGRWELTDNVLFVLDEPTEGVDAAARASIYNHIRNCAADGAAILLLSSSLEEIADVCTRAICLTDGRVTHAIEGEGLTVRNMEHLLVGELQQVRQATGQQETTGRNQ